MSVWEREIVCARVWSKLGRHTDDDHRGTVTEYITVKSRSGMTLVLSSVVEPNIRNRQLQIALTANIGQHR